ncbi:MAG: hypothetical protein COW47_00940 [Candidatus Huberarchaeum crystalense]|uniref:Uncharacterized protein n=1 Tax=Huberarchaeum crystalense TaxID=2014257 RepID=A0A2G9LJN0_HUBC1|nr:hypothetical protein [archaeon]OIP20593.1 MAG: hypothetical protein AUJ91_00950 [archaeon CG2_30_31_98]PIN66714.1 MAG: hypothetical protein COW69_00700 [Candidatus Huberarchaeum crystalense]NCS98466.1 hypothetical protein [archaeon]PIV13525.1 MAG: hypothetical protein COS45_02395 [Candidatus Huberarchaeum crystalense]
MQNAQQRQIMQGAGVSYAKRTTTPRCGLKPAKIYVKFMLILLYLYEEQARVVKTRNSIQ